MKRAPPWGESSTSTDPPCDSATARTIASPRPLPPLEPEVSAGPFAAHEAPEDLVAHLGRDARAVVGDLDHGLVVVALGRSARSSCPRACGGQRSRAGSGRGGGARRGCPRPAGPARGRPRARARPAAARPRRAPPRRPSPGRRRCGRCGGRRRLARAAAGRRRGATSGASIRARSRPRGGRPRPQPGREAWSSSRFACTLVSGVRSSCEASATNSRWRSNARLAGRALRRRGPRASRPSSGRARRPRRRRTARASGARGRGWR